MKFQIGQVQLEIGNGFAQVKTMRDGKVYQASYTAPSQSLWGHRLNVELDKLQLQFVVAVNEDKNDA